MNRCADVYWNAFRTHAIDLVLIAHARVKDEVTPHTDEPEVTGRIAKAIQTVLSEDDRYRNISLHENEPLNQADRFGSSRYVPDLQFELTMPRPRFIFEAKRLREPDKRIALYLGQEGLGRFIDNRYPCPQNEAGMLGYVQSHTRAYWLSQIERQYPLQPTNQMVWSRHECFTGESIRICHVLLDFARTGECL